jgi:alpha-tubulin suppressor-like RCC1 family protein
MSGTNCLATKTDGTLWAWGQNNWGQLGTSDTINKSSPTQVGTGTNWNFVSAGAEGACIATKTDGTMWAWGYNSFAGSLGLNDKVNRSSPVQVGSETNWDKAYASGRWIIAVKTDGSLWSIGGSNYLGVNGLNTNNTYRSSPTQIGSNTNWNTVDASRNSFMVITTN